MSHQHHWWPVPLQVGQYVCGGPTSAANARFFAGARRVVLALVARVRHLERWNDSTMPSELASALTQVQVAELRRERAEALLRRLARGEAIGDEVRAYFEEVSR